MIRYLRSRAVDSIIRYYRETSHRHVGLLPNARMGLHAIARTCFAPGDRVLISPLTCHTVIEAFLQGGVSPVFANINPMDGNIDITSVGRDVLGKVKAIVTTNLYGNPDCAPELADMAKRRNLLLIEDCAHVFETTVDGRRIGTIGDLSVFSFKKFFGVPGGVLAGGDAKTVDNILERLRRSCRFPSGPRELTKWARRTVGRSLKNLPGFRKDHAEVESVHPVSFPGSDSARAAGAVGVGPRIDIADYTTFPLVEELTRVAAILGHAERFRDEWERGNRELIRSVPLEYRGSPLSSKVVHMAVPFFSARRDDLLAHLRARGIPVWYLYNPPMNYLYKSATSPEISLDLDRLEHWRQRILPFPGKHAGRIVGELEILGVALKSTAEGTSSGGACCGRR